MNHQVEDEPITNMAEPPLGGAPASGTSSMYASWVFGASFAWVRCTTRVVAARTVNMITNEVQAIPKSAACTCVAPIVIEIGYGE